MPTSILTTKLYIPPPRPKAVLRPRLVERLNEGLPAGRAPGVTLISAPAGFGKTTLVSEWLAGGERPAAWLSLDEGDNDPARFLVYLVAAVQTLAPHIGAGVMAALQTSQPPPLETLLTTLLNEIAAIPDHFILVLDDYHMIEAKPVDQALTFLLDHLPPQMRLIIATREDPHLPLARYRVRGQLTELRAADLRFTPAEAAEFLNRVMGLNLSAEEVAALETRTEGWIAGLQLAALSMQGQQDTAGFIKSFTGSHHFVLDYLVEEVLHQQPASVQTFLLRTSILNRLCGPLCDAVLGKDEGGGMNPLAGAGDEEKSSSFRLQPSALILEYLERANLFIVPLDNERHWYRYHHLFAGFLRQRLCQNLPFLSSLSLSKGTEGRSVAELHSRASQWYEDHGLTLEAFHHAAAANDVERAERLIEGKGMPLHFRGVATAILSWLASLPAEALDARPLLRVRQATLLLVAGQTAGVEEKLQAAEAALQRVEPDDRPRDLIGQIACARATLALTRYEPEAMLAQSRRALEYLSPHNLIFRFTALWILMNAYGLQGDRAAASQVCIEALSISQASGNIFSTILATSALGQIQELENQLYAAAETYRRSLQLEGDPPLPNASEAYLGLARIYYEWNNLEVAEQHGQKALQLARQYDRVIDRFIICEVFLARLKLAQSDVSGAAAILAEADQSARQKNFVHRLPEIAAAQVLTLIRQGNLAAAAHLAQTSELPLSRARVHLAQGDPSAALAVLEPLRQQMAARGWQDERLKVMVLQAVALHAHGKKKPAAQALGDALALAEPGGFIRIFVDEGLPLAELLTRMKAEGRETRQKAYIDKLLTAFDQQKDIQHSTLTVSPWGSPQPLIEPLSEREIEVLQLIANGLTNQEIAHRLCLSLNTVKVHTRNIYGKLGAHHRADAVAKARALGILHPN